MQFVKMKQKVLDTSCVLLARDAVKKKILQTGWLEQQTFIFSVPEA